MPALLIGFGPSAFAHDLDNCTGGRHCGARRHVRTDSVGQASARRSLIGGLPFEPSDVTLPRMSATLWFGVRRRSAGWLLLVSWLLVVAASAIDNPSHALGPRVFATVLLWLVWRGGTWARSLLIGLSAVSAGFAVALSLAIALGAPGIVTAAVAMFALYAASGALLLTPAVLDLARDSSARRQRTLSS